MNPILMPDGVPGIAPLTDREFAQFQRLIQAEAGISLVESKRALLVGRLARRVRELGLPSFGAYYQRVVAGDGGELVVLLDAIATNETHFFREPRQFELLTARLCPAWLAAAASGERPRRVRIWSAACSTGEEAYSLAMVLHSRLALEGWEIEMLASDLSTRALARARAGVWPREKTEAIPGPLLRAYMLRGVGPNAGKVSAGPELRGLIRFERINLHGASYPVVGGFDAIFCRNVLIYFDRPTRERVLARLAEHLAPGGYLFLGHAESLTDRSLGLQLVLPAVYRAPTSSVPRRVA